MEKDYTKILIKNLELDMFIGVHDHEKANAQRVVISVELNIQNNAEWKKDSIEGVINYEIIVSAIKDIAGRDHIDLIETFVEYIANFCLHESKVDSVKVLVEKPDIFSFMESIAVEIFRQKAEASA